MKFENKKTNDFNGVSGRSYYEICYILDQNSLRAKFLSYLKDEIFKNKQDILEIDINVH